MNEKRTQMADPRRRRGAFTIIELTIVISIIILLVAIAAPTLNAVLSQAGRSRTQAFITSLANATRQYYRQNGNTYPGQNSLGAIGPGENPGNPWGSAGPPSGNQFTGSQWLARGLFTTKGVNFINADSYSANFPVPAYMEYRSEYLIDVDGDFTSDGSDRPDTLSDMATDAMPLCYFPSNPAFTGVKPNEGDPYRQFRFSDNEVYMVEGRSAIEEGDGDAQENFSAYLMNRNTWQDADGDGAMEVHETLPRADGEFLLIAPGKDRLYFTSDDITNK